MLCACGCVPLAFRLLFFLLLGFWPALGNATRIREKPRGPPKNAPGHTKGTKKPPTSRPKDHLGAPRGPQETPNAPQRTPEGHQKTTWRHQGAPKRHPKHPKGPQKASKRPPRAPQGTPKSPKKGQKRLQGTPLERRSLYLGRPLESTVPAEQNSLRKESATRRWRPLPPSEPPPLQLAKLKQRWVQRSSLKRASRSMTHRFLPEAVLLGRHSTFKGSA